MSRLAKMLPFLYFFFDATSIALSLYLIANIAHATPSKDIFRINLVAIVLVWYGISYVTNLYSSNLHNGTNLRARHYAKNYVYFAVFVFLLKLFLPTIVILSSRELFYFILCFIFLNSISSYILVATISRFRRRSENIKNTLVIGVSDVALRISNYINSNPDFGFQIIGYISTKDEERKVKSSMIVGPLSHLEDFLEQRATNEIIIALPHRKTKLKKINRIIDAADYMGARISFVPDYEGLLGKNYKIIKDNQLEAVTIHRMPLDEAYPTLEKGIFDFVFSLVVLTLLTPILLFLAIAIKLDSKGPVFYCPIRVGRGGKDFKLYKFRTMQNSDSEFGGTKSTLKNDPRITRVGRIMRKYNLDELPQFLNVLLGDMSVVGPRPHRNYLNEKMKEHVEKYMLRHYFRPGITGWAQANGWRGPTETEEQIKQRTAHDLWYIENWSFFLDLKIIWLTIFGNKALENAY